MCSSDNNQHHLKNINNDEILNAKICLSSDSTCSATSGDDRPIDLLNPSVEEGNTVTGKNKSNTSSKKSNISISKKSSVCSKKSSTSNRTLKEKDSVDKYSKYWNAKEVEEDEVKNKEDDFEDIDRKGSESTTVQNKELNVIRRRSGITFSDFQLRKSQIEKLLLSPDEIQERKARRKLEFLERNTDDKSNEIINLNRVGSSSKLITHGNTVQRVNEYNKCQGHLVNDSPFKRILELSDYHHKSGDVKLKVGNINKSVDRILLRSISRQKIQDKNSQFRCSRSKYSLTKQSDENIFKHNKQESTLRSPINLLQINENQSPCDQILNDSPSDLSQQKESVLSESRSDIDKTSSNYSTSPENLLCDNEGIKDEHSRNNKHRLRHHRKRKPWTIQETENRKIKSGQTDNYMMYCGDIDHRSSLYTKYGAAFYKQSLFKQPVDPRREDKEVKRVFPFEATPSGNLKVGPKQVVFESKKVSVLVADPYRTKVNVKADVDDKTTPPTTTSGDRPTFTSMQLPPVPRDLLSRMPPIPTNRMPPPGMGGQIMGRADGDFPAMSPPISFVGRSEENSSEETRVDAKKYKHIPEMNLVKMGYNGKDTIDWSKITLPLKSDLHKLLHHRISNYINPDFIVQIGNHEYRCHLLVLQCYSTFFENLDKNIKTVDLSTNNVTGDAFESLYTWMLHLGQDSYQLLRRDNILEMFMAAQFLGVKELEEQCWAFIDNEELFSEDTAFLLYLDARRLGHTAVMELMVPRIQRFFLTLVSSKDWLELQVDEVTVFLRSNYICIHCEMEVFMSGVRWLMYDWQKRNIHLVDVMHCVRFGLIAPWQLVDIRRNPESPEFIEITKDADVQRMVEDGLAFAIIKYWYGHESHDYYHWIDLLGLSEPASRNWAGTEKNYLAYREFLADLEIYRNTHTKALNEKKKSKSQVEDSDSLDEDTVTREHLPPAVPVMSVTPTQPQANRQKQTVMQPPPPPPPIPTMVEFIARRGGDQNIGRLRAAGSTCNSSQPFARPFETDHLNTAHQNKSNDDCDVNNHNTEDRNSKINNEYHHERLNNVHSAEWYGYKNSKNRGKCECHWNKPGSSSSDSSCDDERAKRYPVHHHFHHHHRNHRHKHHRHCCDSVSSSTDDKTAQSQVPSATVRSDIICERVECIEKKPLQNLSTVKMSLGDITKTKKDNKIYRNILNSSLKVQAAIIIQTYYRSYAARKLRKKLLQEKSMQKEKKAGSIKKNETGKDNEKRKDTEQKEEEEDEKRVTDDRYEFCDTVASVTALSKKSCEEDTQLQQQKERPAEMMVKTKQEERGKNTFKKLLPENVSKEMELQFELQKEAENEKERQMNQENKETLLKPSTTTTNSTNDFYKNDKVIETLLYRRKSDTGSKTSLVRPVRIGTMPAEYLVPGSLFLSNKECVLVFGGVDPHHNYGIGHNNGKGVFRYIQNRRHWDLVDELPEPRHHHAVAFCKGKVYLIGGADPRGSSHKNKSSVVSSVYSFDPVSRLWTAEAPLKTPRKNFGLVACSGKLYAIGGENNQERLLSSVECYCPKRKVWEDVAPLNSARMGLAATKYRDTIWVAGGYIPSKRTTMSRSVECYDQRLNTWHLSPSLRIPRCFASLFVINDTLYLIGGASYNIKDGGGIRNTMSINDVDVWDDRGQEWKIHSQLGTARHAHSVCYLGNSLLVIGGVSTERMCALNDVECWNLQRGAWIGGVAELPTTLSGHGSITLPPASLL